MGTAKGRKFCFMNSSKNSSAGLTEGQVQLIVMECSKKQVTHNGKK
jgi:hypothetical protein